MRIETTCDNWVQVRWEMVEQKGERVADGLILDEVIDIQNQYCFP